jgi:hypothetical protein
MNWIKENKFLTGVLAVAIIGGGVLGYLLFAAYGKYDEASGAFDAQSGELHRLEALAIFPDQKNLNTLKKQAGEYESRIKELQRSLEAMQLPIEPLTPAEFQDRLKAAVTSYAEKANGIHLKLPDKFFLGYERYQSIPPRPEAAPLLGRELKAIEWVLGRLVDDGVLELAAVKPEELAEEKGEKEDKADARRPGAPGIGGPGGPGGPGRGPIRKSAFTLGFVCDENTLRTVLNDIVTAKSQLYIVRSVELKSTNEKPPVRETANAGGASEPAAGAPAPAPAETPNPANPANPPAAGAPGAVSADAAIKAGEVTKFVVGEEKVQVTLLIEIVTFLPPADDGKDGKPNPKRAQ